MHSHYRRLREDRRRHRYILIAPCRFDGAAKRSLRRNRIEVQDVDVLCNLERNYTQGRTPRLDEIRISGATRPQRIAEADGTPTGLTGYLRERGIKQLFFVGLATDYCVAWSAMDARRERFGVLVIEDACRAIDMNGSLAKAWQDMSALQVGRIISSQIA